MLIGVDRYQCRIIKNYIIGILHSSKILEKMIDRELTWEIYLKNGVIIEIRSSNFRSVRGRTIVLAILEECAFWRSEESANPDLEVYRSIVPSQISIPGSLLIGISTAYRRTGLLYSKFRENWGQGSDPLIFKSDTLTLNPTIPKKFIDQEMKKDPTSARTEYYSDFRSDLSTFLDLEVIESVIRDGLFEIPPGKEDYRAFIDPSSGSRDSFTLAISHREGERIILDLIREKKPPFRPSNVVEEFSKILKDYKLKSVTSDKYAVGFVKDEFEKNGIQVDHSELNKSEIYLESLPLFLNGSVQILDNERLKIQLSQLERRTRSGGKDSVDHPPKSHDDIANSVCGSLVLSGKEGKKGFFMWSDACVTGDPSSHFDPFDPFRGMK